jgi:hypothetical protein
MRTGFGLAGLDFGDGVAWKMGGIGIVGRWREGEGGLRLRCGVVYSKVHKRRLTQGSTVSDNFTVRLRGSSSIYKRYSDKGKLR